MLAYIYKSRTNFKAIDGGHILLMETQHANAVPTLNVPLVWT